MTGEVSLTGRVLPIGGLKQKLLAAQRAGLTEVFVPARNEPDLDDVPADVLEAVTVHLVSDVREILALALEPAAAAGGDRRRLSGPSQRPLNTGGRFSARAAAASRTSSLAQQAANDASISAVVRGVDHRRQHPLVVGQG